MARSYHGPNTARNRDLELPGAASQNLRWAQGAGSRSGLGAVIAFLAVLAAILGLVLSYAPVLSSTATGELSHAAHVHPHAVVEVQSDADGAIEEAMKEDSSAENEQIIEGAAIEDSPTAPEEDVDGDGSGNEIDVVDLDEGKSPIVSPIPSISRPAVRKRPSSIFAVRASKKAKPVSSSATLTASASASGLPDATASDTSTRSPDVTASQSMSASSALVRCPKPATLACIQKQMDCWTGNGSWLSGAGSTGRDPYVWMPSSGCTAEALPMLSAELWCEVNRGTRQLFLGDSLSNEVYDATLQLMQDAYGDGAVQAAQIECRNDKSLYPFQDGCVAARIPRCNALLGFVRNDHLLLTVTERLMRSPDDIFQHPVKQALDMLQPTHVHLNRGSHYNPDDRQFEAELLAAVAYVKQHAPSATIILRDTPMGHPDCMRYKAPIFGALPPELTNLTAYPWGWGNFPRQNKLIRSVAKHMGLLYVGFATSTLYRPDGHPDENDCLHYVLHTCGASCNWVRLTLAAVSLTARLQPL